MDTSEFEYLKGNFHVIVADVLTILNVNCICRGKNVQLHPILAVKNDNFPLTVKFKEERGSDSHREKVYSPCEAVIYPLHDPIDLMPFLCLSDT